MFERRVSNVFGGGDLPITAVNAAGTKDKGITPPVEVPASLFQYCVGRNIAH